MEADHRQAQVDLVRRNLSLPEQMSQRSISVESSFTCICFSIAPTFNDCIISSWFRVHAYLVGIATFLQHFVNTAAFHSWITVHVYLVSAATLLQANREALQVRFRHPVGLRSLALTLVRIPLLMSFIIKVLCSSTRTKLPLLEQRHDSTQGGGSETICK